MPLPGGHVRDESNHLLKEEGSAKFKLVCIAIAENGGMRGWIGVEIPNSLVSRLKPVAVDGGQV